MGATNTAKGLPLVRIQPRVLHVPRRNRAMGEARFRPLLPFSTPKPASGSRPQTHLSSFFRPTMPAKNAAFTPNTRF